MRRIFLVTSLWLVVLSLGSCSSCGKKDKTLLALVPADVPGALVFPDLAQTVVDIRALMEKFSVGPLATFINQGLIETTNLLGFDPLEVEDLKKLGFDPARGLAIVPVDQQPVLVAGVANQKALEAEIAKRMKELAAAEEVTTTDHEGVKVTTISVKLGEQNSPRLHYAFAGEFVLLAGPETPAKSLASLIKLEKEQSLEGAAWYNKLQGRTPAKPDMLLVLNAKKPELFGPEAQIVTQHIRQGLVLALSLDATGLETQVFLGLEAKTAEKINGFVGGVEDAHLERYLPEDTVMAFKGRLNVGRVLDELFGMDPGFKAEFDSTMQAAQKATGADVEKGSVRNLTGNFVAGLSLGGADQINKLMGRIAKLQAEQPTGEPEMQEAFQLFYWAQIRDAAAWVQVMENVLPLASKETQVQVEHSQQGPLKVVRIQGPEMGTALFLLQKEDLIGGCLGTDCQKRAAELVSGKAKALPASLSPGTKRLFDEPSMATGYLNCGLVFKALSGLDASAFGDGGMLVKMMLDMGLTAIKNLKEVTGVLRILPEGIALSGRLEIQ